MTTKQLENIAIRVSLQIVVLYFESVDQKETYQLKLTALSLLYSTIECQMEIPSPPVIIFDDLVCQLLADALLFDAEVGGSNPLFRCSFKFILKGVKSDLYSIFTRQEKPLTSGDISYGRVNGAVSYTTDGNFDQAYVEQFRKVVYQEMLVLIKERINQIEVYRHLMQKVNMENKGLDMF